jgi:hypothetical protein
MTTMPGAARSVAARSVAACSVLSVPFYDARVQQYTKILCVNAVPPGPLINRVKTVRPPRLSGLSGSSSSSSSSNCIHALTGASSPYMTPDDLPELFAFLMSNGYTVDTGLTKLAAKHQGGGGGGGGGGANSLVCIISYNDSTK